MFKILEKEREKYIYNSVQELILEAIREKYVRNANKRPTKKGRPRKIVPEKILTRKKIFVRKGGEVIDI